MVMARCSRANSRCFVSYIPFLIWVDLVTRLHAFRFTRLHKTKVCLRLRACRWVCNVIVGLSIPTHAAAPRQLMLQRLFNVAQRATGRPPMLPPTPQPRTTTQHACNPARLQQPSARCSAWRRSRNHGLSSRLGLEEVQKGGLSSSLAAPAKPARVPCGPRRTRIFMHFVQQFMGVQHC
jgi:hypothetical protein